MHDRDAILAATDLRVLADELLGPDSASARTATWHCPNPQHAQTGRTPPVSIFLSHRGQQRWRCHGCGEGGTAIDLVVLARGASVRGALELLAARARTGASDGPPAWVRHDTMARAKPDPEGLARYVDDCARRLWQPSGRHVLQYLTTGRGLDPEVLRINRVGADPGPRDQWRPRGMPRAAGAVLPVLDHEATPVYAQLRILHPRPDQPRYLNPASALAPNPKLTHLRPRTVQRRHVVVAEGAIDGLTAASAGYQAVAVLGAGYPDDVVAAHLARVYGPIVLAFDPDIAGTLGSHRLAGLLAAHHRAVLRLAPGTGDLNDQRLAAGPAWPARLDVLVERATPVGERSRDGPRHHGLGVA